MKTQICGIATPSQPHSKLLSYIIPFNYQLAAAHEKKDKNWTMHYLQSAYDNYLTCRENGEAQDNPAGELNYDGKAEWKKQPDGYYHVEYTEGPGDKAWMEARDRNYVFRLEREGKLDKLEPNLRTEVPKLYEEVMVYRAKRAAEAEVRTETEVEKRETKKPKPM